VDIPRFAAGWRHGRPTIIGHVTGLTLAVCGLGVALCGLVDLVEQGSDTWPLLITGAAEAAVGIFLWRFTSMPEHLRVVDVFTTVTLSWVVLALAGATPYVVTGWLDPDTALFESISGFTTTGATVLRPIEGTSPGILFWRAMTQWIGGMGVIVLVVAVLPTVGSGGMSLLQAEAPGPTGERLTPRVRHTARRLWGVYVGFTIVLAAAYDLAGMGLYDAVAHSFTTVSTGGFSPYNASLGHFDSAAIEWIAIVAMFLAGGSFTLYFRALRGNVSPLLRSAEVHLYLVIVALASAYCFLANDASGSTSLRLRDSIFSVTSVVSTTGYATTDFALWSQGTQTLLLMLMPIGAMAGSTAGGVKLLRVLAVSSYAHREALRQLHPRLVRPVRVGGAILPDRVANRVMAFMVLALAVFGGGALLIAMTGPDMITSFSAAATAFGNVGPGLGDVGPTNDFLALPVLARLVTMGQMLLGRLEIYPVILSLSFIVLRPRRHKPA
jgi:trk system potassium uptake protein